MSTTPITNLSQFGRAYSLKVLLPPSSNGDQTCINISDNSFGDNALRITFRVETVFYASAWFAEIEIYNLDQPTTKQIVGAFQTPTADVATPAKQGMTCILSAGYQNGNFGVIWNGPVFQARFARPDVVDNKIILNCLLWLDPMTRQYVSQSYGAYTTQTQVLLSLAEKLFGPNSLAITSTVNPTHLSRGKVVFGSVAKHFTQMADDNNMQWFLNHRGLSFARVDSDLPTQDKAKVLTPDNGIVGVPTQTQYGVDVRVLLDPTIQVNYPAQLIKIDNSIILQEKKTFGEVPSVLDSGGVYIVAAVRYVGDSRGTPWYTEITGMTTMGARLAMLQSLQNGVLNH